MRQRRKRAFTRGGWVKTSYPFPGQSVARPPNVFWSILWFKNYTFHDIKHIKNLYSPKKTVTAERQDIPVTLYALKYWATSFELKKLSSMRGPTPSV